MKNSLNSVSTKKGSDLIEAIEKVCHEMSYTNLWFQMEDDDDLIEACIHQMEVLNAKYRYLIREARSKNITFIPPLEMGARSH